MNKKYDGKDIKEYLTKEVALKIIKEENLEVIWYDEALNLYVQVSNTINKEINIFLLSLMLKQKL